MAEDRSKGTTVPRETYVEHGRQGGLKSAQVRAERAKQRRENPGSWVSERLLREAPELVNELLDAAKGRGAWGSLPMEKRLQALMKALEYGLGRPVSADKTPGVLGGEPKPEAEVARDSEPTARPGLSVI